MDDLTSQILAALQKPGYQPLKPKALARKLGVPANQYPDFRRALRELLGQGRVEKAKNHALRVPAPHGTVVGVYRRTGSGVGFVRPHAVDGKTGPEILVRADDALDAATGDEVLARVLKKPNRRDQSPVGRILEILERSTHQFVGTYFERDGQGLVRVDGTVFSHSVYVGDPGAKGARPDDKVVVEQALQCEGLLDIEGR